MFYLFAVALSVTSVEPTSATRESLMQAREEVWLAAERLEFGPHEYRTSFRALWSESGLYLRFDVIDPAPWHTMTRRDDPIWEEEVVEIFLDLDGSGTHYAEVELSPANVVCDVRMIRGVPDKEMDLSYDLEGLTSRVHPLERGGEIVGWTGVLFLPWAGFRPLPSAGSVSLPPQPQDRWKFNAYRIERPGGPDEPNEDVVFAPAFPTGSESFHVPASFQYLVFR